VHTRLIARARVSKVQIYKSNWDLATENQELFAPKTNFRAIYVHILRKIINFVKVETLKNSTDEKIYTLLLCNNFFDDCGCCTTQINS
jgi:hypothetical protein